MRGHWQRYMGRWHWSREDAERIVADLNPDRPNTRAAMSVRFYACAIPPETVEQMDAGTYEAPKPHVAPSLDDVLAEEDWAEEDRKDQQMDAWDDEWARRKNGNNE